MCLEEPEVTTYFISLKADLNNKRHLQWKVQKIQMYQTE